MNKANQSLGWPRDIYNKNVYLNNHVMSLVIAFLGSVFDMEISIHINEIDQPIDELYDNQHTKF